MNKINASVVIPSHRFDASSMRRLILTIDLFLNQGAAASGDYLLFATDDDTFLPVGVQSLANAIAVN